MELDALQFEYTIQHTFRPLDTLYIPPSFISLLFSLKHTYTLYTCMLFTLAFFFFFLLYIHIYFFFYYFTRVFFIPSCRFLTRIHRPTSFHFYNLIFYFSSHIFPLCLPHFFHPSYYSFSFFFFSFMSLAINLYILLLLLKMFCLRCIFLYLVKLISTKQIERVSRLFLEISSLLKYL